MGHVWVFCLGNVVVFLYLCGVEDVNVVGINVFSINVYIIISYSVIDK